MLMQIVLLCFDYPRTILVHSDCFDIQDHAKEKLEATEYEKIPKKLFIRDGQRESCQSS